MSLKKLGPLTPAGNWTLLVFLSVALLWIFRTPKVIGSLVISGITT